MKISLIYYLFIKQDGTINFLRQLGLSNDKMVLGLAGFGRSFILKKKFKNPKIGLPTQSNGFVGKFMKQNGFLAHFEICDLIQSDSTWTLDWDDAASVPYMYNNKNEWVSFENEKSLRKKVNFL